MRQGRYQKQYRELDHIGFKVFSDWMNNSLKFQRFGGIGNHDHSLGEVRSVLERNKQS